MTSDSGTAHGIIFFGWAFIFGRNGIKHPPVQLDDKDLENARAALVEYLRSEKPLGRGERDMIAEMIAGEWKRSRGQPRAPGMLKYKYAEHKVRQEQIRLKANGINMSLVGAAESLGSSLFTELDQLASFRNLDETEKLEKIIEYINRPASRK